MCSFILDEFFKERTLQSPSQVDFQFAKLFPVLACLSLMGYMIHKEALGVEKLLINKEY